MRWWQFPGVYALEYVVMKYSTMWWLPTLKKGVISTLLHTIIRIVYVDVDVDVIESNILASHLASSHS